MIPNVEVYLHIELPWLDEVRVVAWQRALGELVRELLRQPKGPDHVLDELESVEISVVDDATIARVHGDFLDDPTPTDVITFPHGEGIGEILVSAETAEAYATAHNLAREEELFRYMTHGLVHLHGYLDASPEERAELFAVQEPLVRRFAPLLP